MDFNKIKLALKARADSLGISQPESAAVASAPVITVNPPVKNADENPALQFPLSHSAQIQPAVNGDKDKTPVKTATPLFDIFPAGTLLPPTEGVAKTSAEKPARKPTNRKLKENSATIVNAPVPVVSAPYNPQISDIEVIIAKHLKAGRDFDRLPNTSKPTLLKSGAETLAGVFGFRSSAKVINRIENFDQQFVLYEVCVTVFDSDGNTIAEGLGSCNSRERRYLKSDFASNLNTILKMAKKRAYIDAILTATHSSKVFTQDIEDIVNFQLASDNKQLR